MATHGFRFASHQFSAKPAASVTIRTNINVSMLMPTPPLHVGDMEAQNRLGSLSQPKYLPSVAKIPQIGRHQHGDTAAAERSRGAHVDERRKGEAFGSALSATRIAPALLGEVRTVLPATRWRRMRTGLRLRLAGLEGLRRRTRAMNGRCQGFFCGAEVAAAVEAHPCPRRVASPDREKEAAR